LSAHQPQWILAAVTNWPFLFSSEIPLMFSVRSVISFLSIELCVGKVLFFLKRGDFLFFSELEKAYSFVSFGL